MTLFSQHSKIVLQWDTWLQNRQPRVGSLRRVTYAFGALIFQILSGKCKINQLNQQGAEFCRYEDFIDANLEGNFGESEAAKLVKIGFLCTEEAPSHRPTIEIVMEQLNDIVCNC